MRIQEVTVPDILLEREERVKRQEKLISEFKVPVICLTLNIAGPIKRTDLTLYAFHSAENKIEHLLDQYHVQVLDFIFTDRFTGTEKIWSIADDALKIKKILLTIEETHPLGRLFDIDVIKPTGEKVSRKEVGAPQRSCLICKSPGSVCARSRAHSVDELRDYTNLMIEDYILKEDIK